MASKRLWLAAVAGLVIFGLWWARSAAVSKRGEPPAAPAAASAQAPFAGAAGGASPPLASSAAPSRGPSSAAPLATAPAAPPAPAADGAAELSADDTRRLVILREVLASKNDNDPRLDSDLKQLTPALKLALEHEYRQMPAERRNGRGALAFLVGRNLSDSSDLHFLGEILHEPPCLSLESCAHAPNQAPNEHAAMASETTLSYPQLVAIHSLARYLATHPPEDSRAAARKILTDAAASDNPRVASAASQALSK